MSGSPCGWDGASHYDGCDCHESAWEARVKRLEEDVLTSRTNATAAQLSAAMDEAFMAGWRAHQRHGLTQTVDGALARWRGAHNASHGTRKGAA